MTYLLDSDWVADYLKGRDPAVEIVDSLYSAGLAISIITYAEVLEGIYYGRRREYHEAMFRRLLQGIDVLGVSRRVAERYARMSGQLRSQGRIISSHLHWVSGITANGERAVRHSGRNPT